MSMKLGYDLTIEQAQKLVMTPELIQAIQILQFNTQELDAYIQEQLLVNPVLEQSSDEVSDSSSHDAHEEHFDEEKKEQQSSKDDDFDWKEYLKDRQYDDISYRQSEYPSEDDKERNYERYVTSDVTLPEHLMFQLQFADRSPVGLYSDTNSNRSIYCFLPISSFLHLTIISHHLPLFKQMFFRIVCYLTHI